MDVDSVTWMQTSFIEISSPSCTLRLFCSCCRSPGRTGTICCAGISSWMVLRQAFPYTAEPVIIIRFCDAMVGTLADRLWHSLIWADHSKRLKSAATIDVSELIDLPPYDGIKSWDLTFDTYNRNIVYCPMFLLISRGTHYLPFTIIKS